MKRDKLIVVKHPRLLFGGGFRGYDLGGALGIASTATMQIADGVKDINNVTDRARAIEEDIKEQKVNPSPSSSTDELLSKWSSWNPLSHITWKDLLNKGTAPSYGVDMLSNSAEGAMAGAKLGPIAAIAGGVGGLASGFFGNLFAKKRAKKKAKRINKIIDANNLYTQMAFSNQAEQLENEMLTNDLASFTGWSSAYGGPLFANGGKIHIKKANRGKFTEYCGGKVTSECITRGKKSSSPAIRKRAIFAENARNWKHAFGGDLLTHGANFDTGVTLIGNGGTHEENPNEGVPMGMDSEGIPNLVEEGEVIYNDYVFSKRLKVPKEVRKKYKLKGTKSLTFADAALQMSKESEERPNDPISKAGLEANMIRLMAAQEELREATGKGNKFSRGGKMGRLYAGLNTDPFPNVLSIANRGFAITPFDEMLGPIYVTGGREITVPPKGGNLVNPNMPYVNTLPPVVNDIEGGPVLEQMTLSPAAQAAAKESKINRNVPGEVRNRIKQAANRIPKGMDYLRFAQVFSQAGQHLKDSLGITNRPDFALGRKIREANNQVRGISTRAAGQKLGYTPDDEWAAINNFNSQMAAQRSALRNAGNRVGLAGQLLASAYNQNRALGALYSGMGKANWEKFIQAVAHNTSVDQANRAAELQAAQADASQGNIRAQNLINAARADDAEELAYAQARAANRDNFYNTLGALGKERIDRAMLEGLINSGLVGTPNEAMLTALNYLGINPTVKKSKGGKINRKRRGLTY